MKILLRFLILALAVIAVQYVVPGITVSSFVVALVVAAILAFINMVIKPVISFFAFPLTVLTLGLFSLVINALLFWGVASIIAGFTVTGFVPALLGSIVVAIISWLGDLIVGA